jgi:hypothetical protein
MLPSASSFLCTFVILLLRTRSLAAVNETILYSFSNPYVAPVTTLIADAKGNFYGTARDGGYRCGAVHELSPAAGGSWAMTVLYNFKGGTDGAYPAAPLVMDEAGNRYGTTSGGGEEDPNTYCGRSQYFLGCGVVFELTPFGGQDRTKDIFQGIAARIHPGRLRKTPLSPIGCCWTMHKSYSDPTY